MSVLCLLGCYDDTELSIMTATDNKTDQTLTTKPNTITPDNQDFQNPSSTYKNTTTPTPILTHTPTPPPTITWSPVPTLPPDDALDALLKTYKTNGGCTLPCVWGITPGVTTWQKVREQLSPFGNFQEYEYNNVITAHKFTAEVPEEVDRLGEGYIYITFLERDGVVQEISTNILYVQLSSDGELSSILNEYGKPHQIWLYLTLSPIIEDKVDLAIYQMVLFYPGQGLALSYYDEAQTQKNQINICPQKNINRDKAAPVIQLWDPKREVPFLWLNTPYRKANKFDLLEDYNPDFDPETFFAIFRNPGQNECVEISLDVAWELFGD
jgi:hypothetical protein